MKFTKFSLVIGLFVVLIFVGASCSINSTSKSTENSESSKTATSSTEQNPSGTIVVEAGDGVLAGVAEDSLNYIKESARGLEAYLGSKGATAAYSVEAPVAGTYQLQVKLSDDGTWKDGYRDADVSVNGQAVLHYYHKSEDTRGWKWYTLGNASLKVGANPVSFTKSTDMPAAYVMDEFKFVPVILQ